MSDQPLMNSVKEEYSIKEELQTELDMLSDNFSLGIREFHVLDEISSTNRDSGESDSSSFNEVDTDSESEIPEDEIDAMLDEGKKYGVGIWRKLADRCFNLLGLNEEFSQMRKKQKRNDGSAHDNGDSMSYEEREKIVLEGKFCFGYSIFNLLALKNFIFLAEKGKNHFEVLPENWVQVTHNSGMPIYLHKPTRVCTLAKPYFLGPGSARVRTMQHD